MQDATTNDKPSGLSDVVHLWEAVCNNATLAIYILDEKQRCIYMNPAAERLTGFTFEETRGELLHDLLHHTRPDGTPYPREECPIVSAFPLGVQQQGEEVFVHKDGSFYPVAYTASPIRGSSSQVVGTVVEVRGIRAEKEAEEVLRSETRMLEALHRSGTAVAAELDLDRLVQTVTDAGVELTGAAFGAFFYNVLDDDGGHYMLYSISGVPREAFSRFPMPRNTKVFQPTFAGTGTVRSADITTDPRYGHNAPHRGMPKGHLPVRSYLAVPVTSNSGEVLGGLFFGHPEPGVFSERAERLVDGIASQAAVALDNARLYQAAQREIAARTAAQEQLKLLLDELNHRVKNTLATVQAVASQTLRGPEVADGARERFLSRMLAMSGVHTLLASQNWSGAELHELVAQALKPFDGPNDAGNRYRIEGPPVRLQPKLAQTFAMALHELATNAAKYGALASDSGTVEVVWSRAESESEQPAFRFRWSERGGPPVQPPSRSGFGTRLLREILARDMGAEVELTHRPEGLVCTIEAQRFDG